MCCITKRRIADCVKCLVREKEIRKITVQDIMNGTNMSRQSFYYHFQDIYAVLRWIGRQDLAKMGNHGEAEDIEMWILQLIHALGADRPFYRRIVREIHWPELLEYLRQMIVPETVQICGSNRKKYPASGSGDWLSCVDFFATSLSCYLLEYVYNNRNMKDGQVLRELRFMTAVLERAVMGREQCVLQNRMGNA